VNGVEQRPMDGVSMLYSVDDAKAADRRTTQYFEMFGNRAIYHDGWVAATRHSIPWLMVPLPPVKDDVWELYHVAEDFSQADNLVEKNPAKLKELQDLFMKEAVRNHVLPIDDRRVERFNPVLAGRPDLLGGRKTLTVYPGMTGMMENAGKHTIVYEFIPDAAKPGTGGKSILSVDGQKVAEGQIPKTQPFMFSADEGTDVGLDGETNVSADYKQGDNAFTGRIVRVTVEQK
jgi:hypothetical protein